MADQFNGDHQRRKRGHRSGKVFQVGDAGMLESLRLVINKGANRASQRNDWDGRRGFESRNYADQVTAQDEETERHQKWGEGFTMVADNFMALAFDEAVRAFKDM